MDLLKSMHLFTRIVEQGSFSRVAIENGLSQSAVSKIIVALEKRLGVQLLYRSTRQVKPTEIGNKYYLECRDIIEAVARSEGNASHLRAHSSGLLKLSVPMSFGRLYVVPRIVEFLEIHRELKIELSMQNHHVDLIREDFDLAIQTGPQADSTLIAKKIGKNQRVMVATPKYLELKGYLKNVSELARHNCILTGEPWQLQGIKGLAPIKFSGNLRVNNAEGVREAVLLGLGIGVLPLWSVHKEIQNGKLKIVLPTYSPVSKDIYAVYPSARNPSLKIQKFIAFLEEDLKCVNFQPKRYIRRKDKCIDC